MLHTKTTYPSATSSWTKFCRVTGEAAKKKCPIGIPYDLHNTSAEMDKDGFSCNCYPHERVQQDLVPLLEELLNNLPTDNRRN
jgi:hypothetical protein